MYENGFCVHNSNAILTITEQIYQRIPETMNAKRWHEKAASGYCLSGWSGAGPVSGIRPWWNTFADTNGRPFVRCRPFSPRIACKPFVLRRPAALRDARYFSARRSNLRKMPAAATHRSIRTDLPRLSIPNTRAYDLFASSPVFSKCGAFCRTIQIVSRKIALRSLWQENHYLCADCYDLANVSFDLNVRVWMNIYLRIINFIRDWYWSNVYRETDLRLYLTME